MKAALCTAPNPTVGVFFRNVVVALEPTLQVDRDNGSLPSPILILQETCKADALRSNVIEYCLQQYDSLSDLITGDGLNADMPSHIRYTCLHDRLNAMADPRSMVGGLEISQIAEVLNKTIKIVNKDSDNVEKSLLTQCRFLCYTHHLETVPGTTTLSENQTLVNSSIGSHVLLY